jgi:hypothetical protein
MGGDSSKNAPVKAKAASGGKASKAQSQPVSKAVAAPKKLQQNADL